MSFSLVDRRRRALLAALPAAVFALPVRAARVPPGGAVRLAVGGQAGLYYLPLTVAQALGYFDGAGLQLQIQDYAGGALAQQAVREGRADLCCSAFDHVLGERLAGRPARSLVLFARASQLALAASRRSWPSGDPRRVKRLRIGVTAPGSASEMFARRWLTNAGVDVETVRFVGLGQGVQALSALRQGAVHALSHTDPVLTLLERRGEVRLLADARTLAASQALYGGTMPGGCLWAPQAFIERRSAQAQALVQAMVRALLWLQTASAADLVQVVPPAFLLGQRSSYLAAFERLRQTFSPDGLMPVDAPATALRAHTLLQPALAAARVDLSQSFGNAMAQRALQQLRV